MKGMAHRRPMKTLKKKTQFSKIIAIKYLKLFFESLYKWLYVHLDQCTFIFSYTHFFQAFLYY